MLGKANVLWLAPIAIAAAIAVAADIPLLRIPAGLALVLFLPGCALQAFAFPSGNWSVIERVVLSIGLSLVQVILGGLLLNLTAAGLVASGWVWSLTMYTVILAVAARLRSGRKPKDQTNAEAPKPNGLRWQPDRLPQGMMFAAAAIILGAAVVVAQLAAQNKPQEGFTQLWLVRDPSSTDAVVDLGVISQEKTTTSYMLVLKSGDRNLREWPLTNIAPGAAWRVQVSLVDENPAQLHLEAILYRLSVPNTNAPLEAYRRVAW